MDALNRHKWQTVALVLVGMVLAGPPGWGAEEATQPTETFVVRVDSVIAPSQIGGGDTLTIKLHGVIGPNLCYRFKEFVAVRTEARLELTVLGEVPDLRGKGCPTALAELRDDNHRLGKPFVIGPPIVDPFSIVVHQPDSTTLEKVVRVVPRG
jgi:hypothetical protein